DDRTLGRLSGRPLAVARRGPTVLVAWGEGMLAAGLDARDHPDRSAGPAIRSAWGPASPQRTGAFWPGRLPAAGPPAPAPADSPPVVWTGARDGTTTRDVIRWTGLDGAVRRFLDALPLEPSRP